MEGNDGNVIACKDLKLVLDGNLSLPKGLREAHVGTDDRVFNTAEAGSRKAAVETIRAGSTIGELVATSGKNRLVRDGHGRLVFVHANHIDPGTKYNTDRKGKGAAPAAQQANPKAEWDRMKRGVEEARKREEQARKDLEKHEAVPQAERGEDFDFERGLLQDALDRATHSVEQVARAMKRFREDREQAIAERKAG